VKNKEGGKLGSQEAGKKKKPCGQIKGKEWDRRKSHLLHSIYPNP
jgi:hypothetical protein